VFKFARSLHSRTRLNGLLILLTVPGTGPEALRACSGRSCREPRRAGCWLRGRPARGRRARPGRLPRLPGACRAAGQPRSPGADVPEHPVPYLSSARAASRLPEHCLPVTWPFASRGSLCRSPRPTAAGRRGREHRKAQDHRTGDGIRQSLRPTRTRTPAGIQDCSYRLTCNQSGSPSEGLFSPLPAGSPPAEGSALNGRGQRTPDRLAVRTGRRFCRDHGYMAIRERIWPLLGHSSVSWPFTAIAAASPW
jgi:hypothetical protein